MKLALLFLLAAGLMFGQTAQPQWIMFAGGGYDHYSTPAAGKTPATFYTRAALLGGFAKRITENVYSWNTIVAKSDGAKMMSGIYAQVFDQDVVKFGAIGQIGGESTSGDVTAAASVGGAVQINIGRWFKAPALDLIGVIAVNKSTAVDAPNAVKPAIGIGLAWHSK
jgi:hypothetical protein